MSYKSFLTLRNCLQKWRLYDCLLHHLRRRTSYPNTNQEKKGVRSRINQQHRLKITQNIRPVRNLTSNTVQDEKCCPTRALASLRRQAPAFIIPSPLDGGEGLLSSHVLFNARERTPYGTEQEARIGHKSLQTQWQRGKSPSLVRIQSRLTLWSWKWTFKQQHIIYVNCENLTNQKRKRYEIHDILQRNKLRLFSKSQKNIMNYK